MNHLKNILLGARQVFVLNTKSEYIKPSRRDFYTDVALLRGDAANIASDLNKTARRYGEQTYNGQAK